LKTLSVKFRLLLIDAGFSKIARLF
jgi:hypothetical protein